MTKYFISEQGRILKINLKKKELFILTKDSNNQSQWLPIKLIEDDKMHAFEFHFSIANHHFRELEKVVLSSSSSPTARDNYFVSKSNERISLLPIKTLPGLTGVKFPTDFDNKDQLAHLLADQKTLCKAAAYVRKSASTVNIQGQEKDTSELPPRLDHFLKTVITVDKPNYETLKTALSAPKKKISTVEELKLFARDEIERLDHWYVWNGRAKAQAIKDAVQRLDPQWKDDEDMQHSPVIAARESGLIDALAIHRHTFFYHGDSKAASHDSILEKCPEIKSGM